MSLLAILVVAAATAQEPCLDLSAEVEHAWTQFDDAELEAAKSSIGRAYDNLTCQTEVVPTDVLLGMYRLDALVSLALQDQKAAVYATIRAVAADHVDGAPPDELGPKLAELYQLWAERLSESLVRLSVAGGGRVWIDGRLADASRPIRVAQGEHLVQVEDAGTLVSELHDLSEDVEVETIDPLPEGFVPPAPEPPPVARPDPVPPPPLEPDPPRATRRRPIGLFVGGGVATGIGAAALAVGLVGEQRFHEDPFTDPEYAGCPAGAPCYTAARREAVEAAALRIRVLYLAGYGSVTLGVGALGVGIIGLPAAGAPAGVSIRRRF